MTEGLIQEHDRTRATIFIITTQRLKFSGRNFDGARTGRGSRFLIELKPTQALPWPI